VISIGRHFHSHDAAVNTRISEKRTLEWDELKSAAAYVVSHFLYMHEPAAALPELTEPLHDSVVQNISLF
jgi:hypothetical protein